MRRLIIFDLDGTLIDSLPDIAWSMNKALSEYQMAERSLEEIRSFIGSGTLKLVERASGGQIPDGLTERYRQRYDENILTRTMLYPGINGLLESLKEHYLVILTNKYQSAAERIVQGLLGDSFHMVIGDGQFPRKPDPSAIHFLMEHYQVEGSEACLIGDSRVDQQTAENAGITFLGVDWGYDHPVPAYSLNELKTALNAWLSE